MWARSFSLRISVSVIESLYDAKWPYINLGYLSQQQQLLPAQSVPCTSGDRSQG
jgi:hypothetical protein